ncbi:hypothetical protein HDU76_004230, partial [Blyttiomyces sp. JEL0837]
MDDPEKKVVLLSPTLNLAHYRYLSVFSALRIQHNIESRYQERSTMNKNFRYGRFELSSTGGSYDDYQGFSHDDLDKYRMDFEDDLTSSSSFGYGLSYMNIGFNFNDIKYSSKPTKSVSVQPAFNESKKTTVKENGSDLKLKSVSSRKVSFDDAPERERVPMVTKASNGYDDEDVDLEFQQKVYPQLNYKRTAESTSKSYKSTLKTDSAVDIFQGGKLSYITPSVSTTYHNQSSDFFDYMPRKTKRPSSRSSGSDQVKVFCDVVKSFYEELNGIHGVGKDSRGNVGKGDEKVGMDLRGNVGKGDGKVGMDLTDVSKVTSDRNGKINAEGSADVPVVETKVSEEARTVMVSKEARVVDKQVSEGLVEDVTSKNEVVKTDGGVDRATMKKDAAVVGSKMDKEVKGVNGNVVKANGRQVVSGKREVVSNSGFEVEKFVDKVSKDEKVVTEKATISSKVMVNGVEKVNKVVTENVINDCDVDTGRMRMVSKTSGGVGVALTAGEGM